MIAYNDMLNTFGGDSSYADRYQAAALKGDSNTMTSIIKEYRASQGIGNENKERTTSKNDSYTETYTPQQTSTYTPVGNNNTQYNQGNGNLGNWNYGADTPDRQEEIVSNLNAAYQSNPEQFTDWNTFANNFNYNYSGRSDKERETMRNWYENKMGNTMDYNNANNTDYLFNQLMGGNVLNGTGAALDAARARYNNYKYLSSMTPDQIASAVTSGNLNGVGTEMQDLKNYSPALYAQVQAYLQGKQQLDDINAVGDGIYNGLTSTETNKNYTNYNMTSEYAANASIIKQYNESLYNKIVGLGGDTAAYVSIVASMLQNPNIQASKNEVEDLEGEIRKIQEQMYTIGDTSREVLGSEAPEDLVSAYISHQTKQLQNQLRTAQNSLLVAQGKLNNQLTEVETMMDAINNGIELSAKGMLGGAGDNYDYQTSDPERLQQMQNNLDAIASSDDVYVFRDRNAFNDYFKYSQRSPAQQRILDDYWNANASRLQPIAQQKWNQMNTKSVGGGRGDGGNDSTALGKIKRALLDGSYQGNLTTGPKSYGYKSTAEPTQLMYQLGSICDNAEEVAGLVSAAERFKNTSSESGTSFNVETLKANILNGYWDAQVKKDKETLLSSLKGKTKTSEIKPILSNWLTTKGFDDTKSNRELLADDLGIDY